MEGHGELNLPHDGLLPYPDDHLATAAVRPGEVRNRHHGAVGCVGRDRRHEGIHAPQVVRLEGGRKRGAERHRHTLAQTPFALRVLFRLLAVASSGF